MILGGKYKGPEKPLTSSIRELFPITRPEPRHRYPGEPCENRDCHHDIQDCQSILTGQPF